MTPAQCRAARALLDWSQQKLADESGVGNATIRNFEAARSSPNNSTLQALRRPLEATGVIFVEENGEGPGVRMRKSASAAHDHPEPVGPATEIVKAMDAAIDQHRNSKKTRK